MYMHNQIQHLLASRSAEICQGFLSGKILEDFAGEGVFWRIFSGHIFQQK